MKGYKNETSDKKDFQTLTSNRSKSSLMKNLEKYLTNITKTKKYIRELIVNQLYQ